MCTTGCAQVERRIPDELVSARLLVSHGQSKPILSSQQSSSSSSENRSNIEQVGKQSVVLGRSLAVANTLTSLIVASLWVIYYRGHDMRTTEKLCDFPT